MKKFLAVAGMLLAVAVLGLAAYARGWLHLSSPGSATAPAASTTSPAGVTGEARSPGSEAAPPPGAGEEPAGAPQPWGAPLPRFDGNVASLEWGARLESAPNAEDKLLSDENEGDAVWSSGDEPGPKEIVIAFYDREPALIDRVAIDNAVDHVGAGEAVRPELAPRDVEVWTSMTSATEGFAKAAAASVEPLEQSFVSFAPVEARFVKVRLLRSQSNGESFIVRRVRVLEAQAPGYVPLLTRRPDILGPLATAHAGSASAAVPPTVPGCTVQPGSLPPPGRGESRRVLFVTPQSEEPWAFFPGPPRSEEQKERLAAIPDLAILGRLETVVVSPVRAQLHMLAESQGIDTVVLMLPCIGYPMSPAFKQALLVWVAAGHKLIIQDSDKCVPGPDYSWLPFRFKTDTPGAFGEPGGGLRILEDNWMGHNRRGREGFIDAAAWEAIPDPPANELGDSNVVTGWGPGWCGHMAVRNVHNVFGFVHAYARYGRGLIVYSGLDVDMTGTEWYDRFVARELAQGFAPDNLPCSLQVGSFVIATDTRLRSRAVEPGRSYDYPLTLFSNMKYQGSVTLTAAAIDVPGVRAVFDPPTVAVTEMHRAAMKLTVPADAPRRAFAVEVKGTDVEGNTNSLCLQLGPPTTGEVAVVSALGPPEKTRKNLEIILDASGSMRALLAGKKTRWDVALDTLQQVLARLPDDFNVGLRMYGHREGSKSPRACTDSELLVPVAPLDRRQILDRARSFKPKGETPLVYSALQAPADLKALGGGTVILITDGEESCKGDAVKAAADLKASGLDMRLNIVGFALKNPKVQKDLAGFSQATGGLFYAANNGEALADALMLAAVEKFPYTVYDAAGKVVLASEAGSGSDELPPGDYKVVVKAGTRELVAPRVSVALGQSVTLTIAMKNGQLVLQ